MWVDRSSGTLIYFKRVVSNFQYRTSISVIKFEMSEISEVARMKVNESHSFSVGFCLKRTITDPNSVWTYSQILSQLAGYENVLNVKGDNFHCLSTDRFKYTVCWRTLKCRLNSVLQLGSNLKPLQNWNSSSQTG